MLVQQLTLRDMGLTIGVQKRENLVLYGRDIKEFMDMEEPVNRSGLLVTNPTISSVFVVKQERLALPIAPPAAALHPPAERVEMGRADLFDVAGMGCGLLFAEGVVAQAFGIEFDAQPRLPWAR